MRTLSDEDVAALAAALAPAVVRALAGVEAAAAAVVVGAKPRLSRRAAAGLLGIQPRTFQARYVDRGFIAAGADGCFSRREVMRLRERGE